LAEFEDRKIGDVVTQLSGHVCMSVCLCVWLSVCVKSLFKESSSLERHTPMLRQTILLSVGTICNKMINTMRRHSRPIPQLMTVVQQVSAVRSLYSFLVTHTHTHTSLFARVCVNSLRYPQWRH